MTDYDVDTLHGMDNIECFLVDHANIGKKKSTACTAYWIRLDIGWNKQLCNEGSTASHFTSHKYNLIHDQLNDIFSCDVCEAASETGFSPSVKDIQVLNQMKSLVRRVDMEDRLPFIAQQPPNS